MTERGLVTVLVLPMSWPYKIAGVNILENYDCWNPIIWLRRIVFIFILDIFCYFFIIFRALLRDARVNHLGYH